MNNGSKLVSWGRWSSRALMGIGWGAGTLAAAFFGSNPIGWAAVGVGATAFLVGAGVSWVFNKAYDNNFLGLRDGLDAAGKTVGQVVSHGVESTKSWTTDVTDDIGKGG